MERPVFLASAVMGLLLVGGALWPKPQPPASTTLRVETLPSGAKVLLDDVEIGTSPLETGIEPGKHRLSLRREGYRKAERTLSCPTGQLTSFSLELQADLATLSLKGHEKAQLWLGPGVPEKLSGQGPWQLEPGEYELTGKRDSLPAIPKKFRLKPGERRQISMQWPELPIQALPDAPPPAAQLPRPAPPTVAPVARPVQPPPDRPAWRPQEIPRPQPPRAFNPPEPRRPEPQPLWTPLPAVPAEPQRVPPSEGLFTPLP